MTLAWQDDQWNVATKVLTMYYCILNTENKPKNYKMHSFAFKNQPCNH